MAAGPDDIYSIDNVSQTGQVSIVGVVRVWRQRGQEGHGHDDAGANDHEW
jgi:hypothetical protein